MCNVNSIKTNNINSKCRLSAIMISSNWLSNFVILSWFIAKWLPRKRNKDTHDGIWDTYLDKFMLYITKLLHQRHGESYWYMQMSSIRHFAVKSSCFFTKLHLYIFCRKFEHFYYKMLEFQCIYYLYRGCCIIIGSISSIDLMFISHPGNIGMWRCHEVENGLLLGIFVWQDNMEQIMSYRTFLHYEILS